jgi:hypothetical protein
VSNEARNRDISALLARGVVRVKKQPLIAKAIESHMPCGKSHPTDQTSQAESTQANDQSQDQVDFVTTIQHGGDQCQLPFANPFGEFCHTDSGARRDIREEGFAPVITPMGRKGRLPSNALLQFE